MNKTIFAALMLAHSWYPKECCSDNDCHPVPCAELSYRNGDVIWRDHIYFSGQMIKESKDSYCHVCVRDGVTSEFVGRHMPLCVFIPKVTS